MVTAMGAMMFDTHKRQDKTALTHSSDWISLSCKGLGGRRLAAAAHAQRFRGLLNTTTEGTRQSAASYVEWDLLRIRRSCQHLFLLEAAVMAEADELLESRDGSYCGF